MRIRRSFAACAAALACGAVDARLTEHCNTNFGVGEVYVDATGAAQQALIARVSDPQLAPDIFFRLWEPRSAQVPESFRNNVKLTFDRVQDTEEIAAAIRTDPVLASMGVTGAWPNTSQVCFAALPPSVPVTVAEYFNSALNHYFLSSSDLENAIIDGGGAGPGWSRTGETFRTIQPDYCHGASPVFRFYNFEANTHFFTASTAECGFVRRSDPGWVYEGEAFGARLPVDGACEPGRTPVYRLYNDRWMFRDSNHRFVTRTALRDRMAAEGWISEGVAMCLFPN